MDHFKIRNFEQSGNIKFPLYNEELSHNVIKNINTKLHLTDSNRIYEEIQKQGNVLIGRNALDSDFLITDILHLYDISQSVSVNIIWDVKNNTLDYMSYKTFCFLFPYIWYPGIDDMLVCDTSVSFLFFIRHDGVIFVI